MAAVTDKLLQSETGVSIDRCHIITGTQNRIDLTPQMLEMNIFEDIFSPYLTATILFEDALNLVEKLAICGQEWMFIRVSKPGFEDVDGNDLSFSFLFRIYKIEKVVHHSPFKQQYLMHLVKEDAVFSMQDRLAKSYVNVKPEVAIKDIFDNNLFYGNDNDQYNDAFSVWPMKPSNSAFSFYIPNLRPFEAVTFLSALARNKNNIHDYLFFENNDGYTFASLSEMYQDDPVMTIKYKIKQIVTSTQDSTDPYTNSFSPLAIQNDVLFDYIKSLDQGEFGIQADSFDFSRQVFFSMPVSYDTFLTKYKKDFILDKFPKVPDNDWQELVDKTAKRVPYHRVLEMIPNAQANRFTDFSIEAISTRLMQLSSITNQKIKLHMPGTPLMKAGKTIQLKYPSISSKAVDDKTDDLLDDYLAAKYLIVSVRHVITQKEWHSYCEISKDTLPNKLPANFASNFTLDGL